MSRRAPVHVTAGRCTECGYLTSAAGHQVSCAPRGRSPAVPVPAVFLLDSRFQATTRGELRMCGPCFEDLCIACQGGGCLCACQDERVSC